MTRRAPSTSLFGFQGLVYVPIVIAAFGLVASACGGGAGDSGLTWTVSAGAQAPTTSIEAPIEAATETTAPDETTTPGETTAPGETTTPASTPVESVVGTTAPSTDSPADAELVVLGKEVFEVTAGGVGCASCHGFDGRGSANGPNIISLSRTAIAGAMGGGVPDMDDIKLSSEELDAVSAYLDTLTP